MQTTLFPLFTTVLLLRRQQNHQRNRGRKLCVYEFAYNKGQNIHHYAKILVISPLRKQLMVELHYTCNRKLSWRLPWMQPTVYLCSCFGRTFSNYIALVPFLLTFFRFVQFSEKHDLHREAAFNLSLIYRASGNELMAKELLKTHCWIWNVLNAFSPCQQ